MRLAGVVAERVVAREIDCRLSDWARVEVVDGRLDRRLTAKFLFTDACVNRTLEGARPIRIPNQVAFGWQAAVRQIDRCRGRPFPLIPLGNTGNRVAQRGIHGKTVLGELDRWSEHVRQRGSPEVE